MTEKGKIQRRSDGLNRCVCVPEQVANAMFNPMDYKDE